MTRRLFPAAALAATALLGQPVLAQEASKAGGYVGSERRQASMRINVEADGTDLSVLMERIGQQVGRNILVDSTVQESVSVSLRDIAWREAVDVIAKMTRCEVEVRPGGILLLTQPPKVTIQFTDANVRTVLQLLAAYSGKNVIISPEVTGNVTLDLKEVHWERALRAIVKTVGEYEVVDETDDLLRVVPSAAIRTQLETVVFKLKYARPPALYRAVPPASAAGTTQQAASTVFVGQVQNNAAVSVTETFTLFRALRSVIAASTIQGATMEYDEGTNSFIVTATKPLLSQIKTIITRVDIRPVQIFAEVKFVSTRDNNSYQDGIEFNEGNRDRGLRWSNQQHGPFPLNSAPNSLFARPQNGLPTVGSQVQTALEGDNVPTGVFPFFIGEGSAAFSENFRLPSVLNFQQFDVVVNLIDRDDRARVIQSPSLFMLDNQDAVIFVGDQVPYATLLSSPDANGNVIQTLSEAPGSPVAIGFSLFIQSHVIPDSDRITMTVIPRVNDLVGTSNPALPGFDRFQFGGNLEINLPRTREQALVTHIMLEDASTAVLGGLMTESDTEIIKKVPVLSSLPILGNLFTVNQTARRVENLTIFITPTIVRERKTIHTIFTRATRRLERTDYFYKKFEKPKIALEEEKAKSDK